MKPSKGNILKRLIWLGSSVLCIFGAGEAFASIPAGNGTYTGCYLKATGTLRLIDTAIPPKSAWLASRYRSPGVKQGQRGQPVRPERPVRQGHEDPRATAQICPAQTR